MTTSILSAYDGNAMPCNPYCLPYTSKRVRMADMNLFFPFLLFLIFQNHLKKSKQGQGATKTLSTKISFVLRMVHRSCMQIFSRILRLVPNIASHGLKFVLCRKFFNRAGTLPGPWGIKKWDHTTNKRNFMQKIRETFL